MSIEIFTGKPKDNRVVGVVERLTLEQIEKMLADGEAEARKEELGQWSGGKAGEGGVRDVYRIGIGLFGIRL